VKRPKPQSSVYAGRNPSLLRKQPIGLPDIVLMAVLRGARNVSASLQLERALLTFPRSYLPTPGNWRGTPRTFSRAAAGLASRPGAATTA
jgi:hypothetical protein